MSGYIIEFFSNITTNIRIIDAIDIAIVAFLLYKLLGFIQETRAEQILKGLLVLLLGSVVSELLEMYTLSWILQNTMTIGVIAIIIVFQPELRRGLEYIGRGTLISMPFSSVDEERVVEIVEEITASAEYFSQNKIGALIIFEKAAGMQDIIETGTFIDARISKELLMNIFAVNTALHDGAAIIRGDRIAAAACYLPLSQSNAISKELGTRHRAGIGISETSDAVALIVSEETGSISVAIDGKLTRFLGAKSVSKIITNVYVTDDEKLGVIRSFIKNIWRKNDGNPDAKTK